MTQKELLGDDWIPEEDFAKLRKKKISTLQTERGRKPYKGPPYTKDGREVFYSASGYREWLERQRLEKERPISRRRQ
jgi:hypothetical protein